MKEIWKRIKGFDNYQISNKGNVIGIGNFILKSHISNAGYKLIVLTKENKRKCFLVHRLVALHFIENIYNKDYINHIDLNKLNNVSSNLEWCTAKENMRHAINNGRLDNSFKKSKERMHIIGKRYAKLNGLKLSGLSESVIIQKDINMNILNKYDSFRIAGKETGFNRLKISKSCSNKSLYRGFYWEWIKKVI